MDAAYVHNYLREVLSERYPSLEEKWMFGGTCFMVNDKMCICINERDLLCRIGADGVATEVDAGNCRHMMMNGRTSKDYVYVELDTLHNLKDVDRWLDMCLAYNPQAKASKKR